MICHFRLLNKKYMVDNFEQIKSLLQFDNDDQFYFVQIIKRKKENKELGSNSHIVKFYYIKAAEDLDKNKEEMKLLAHFHNARVCINLNKRSFERTAFHTLKKITDQILNKDFKSARKAYNSVCGMYAGEQDKTWIVDIDEKGRYANEVLKDLDEIQPVGDKLISIIETKNGVHLITKPFNLQKFKEWFPDIEVHKNNPTIIYIP
jgi:hypothetical protein